MTYKNSNATHRGLVDGDVELDPQESERETEKENLGVGGRSPKEN
jgi:hypothetical protein